MASKDEHNAQLLLEFIKLRERATEIKELLKDTPFAQVMYPGAMTKVKDGSEVAKKPRKPRVPKVPGEEGETKKKAKKAPKEAATTETS